MTPSSAALRIIIISPTPRGATSQEQRDAADGARLAFGATGNKNSALAAGHQSDHLVLAQVRGEPMHPNSTHVRRAHSMNTPRV
jgi:hypothetical protein